MGPLTGHLAGLGVQVKWGAERWVADVNAMGGINGHRVRLMLEDDACDPKQAVAAAGRFAAAKVKVVIGHFCSGSSIAAAKVYAEEGMIEIAPASTNPKFTDERAGPTIFRVCGRDDQQGVAAAGYIAQAFKGKSIAVVHDRSAYGKGLADETVKALAALGVKPVLNEVITAGEKDYTAIASKLKAAGADLVYFGGYFPEAGLIIRQLREQGAKTVLMSGDALTGNEFWQITGEGGEGTLITFAPDPRKNAEAADAVARLRSQKIEPEGFTLYTYAAFETWAGAVALANSTEAKPVAAALATGSFKTVLGTLAFDAKGDPKLPSFRIYRWSKGSYEQIN